MLFCEQQTAAGAAVFFSFVGKTFLDEGGMKRETVREELRVCPQCWYTRGFHVFFRQGAIA
jgi:hypothetical protein